MDRTDRNVLRLSGRLRALERLTAVMVIDWAERHAERYGGDALDAMEVARKNTMLGLQFIDRPLDEATEIEWGAMVDALSEIFAGVRSELDQSQP